MSSAWDAYIDNLIGHTGGAADYVCIIGMDGGKWTSDEPVNALKLTADEAATIAKAIKAKDASTFQANGILAGGGQISVFTRRGGFMACPGEKERGWCYQHSTIQNRYYYCSHEGGGEPR